jgi:hypothetical protein
MTSLVLWPEDIPKDLDATNFNGQTQTSSVVGENGWLSL